MALLIKKPVEYGEAHPLYEIGLTDDLIIVGLGNPGSKYQQQRHNLGWRCLDAWADQHQLNWQAKPDLKAELATAHLSRALIRLIKPQTYVNRSGLAVAAIAGYFKVRPEQIWIVYDEIRLAWGRLGVAIDEPLGSHNGLASIADSIGGLPPLPRIQIGIGPQPKNVNRADFVLADLSPAEVADRPKIMAAAGELINQATTGQLATGRHQVLDRQPNLKTQAGPGETRSPRRKN